MTPLTTFTRRRLSSLFTLLSPAVAVSCAQGVGDNGYAAAVDGDASLATTPRRVGSPSADARASRAAQTVEGADERADATAGDEAPASSTASDGSDATRSDDSADAATQAAAGDASDEDDAAGDDGGFWADGASTGDVVLDGASGDDALGDDADTPDAPAGPTSPAVGDLLITEVMFYPSGPEPQCEWFEVYNLADSPRLLSGLTIQDGYPRTHLIAANPPVVAPPHAYVVLVRNQVSAVDELVPPASIAYEYGMGLASGQGIELENGTTGDVSLWSGGTLLVDVPYGPWGMASLGQSIELGSLVFAGSDQAGAWCIAQYSWASGSDDGTPGAPNDCP